MKEERIICGDSLEVLKTLPDESVDCVITSPPYWGLRDYPCDTLFFRFYPFQFPCEIICSAFSTNEKRIPIVRTFLQFLSTLFAQINFPFTFYFLTTILTTGEGGGHRSGVDIPSILLCAIFMYSPLSSIPR